MAQRGGGGVGQGGGRAGSTGHGVGLAREPAVGQGARVAERVGRPGPGQSREARRGQGWQISELLRLHRVRGVGGQPGGARLTWG